MPTLFLSLLFINCSDYELKENLSGEPPTTDSSVPEIDTVPPPDCSVELAEPFDIETTDECVLPEYNIEEPWNVEVEWQWTGLSAEPFIDQVMVAPIVGNLNDDDGDGFVSAYDTPDIVIVAFDSRDGPMGDQGAWVDGRLLAIDGSTGAVHWSRDGFYWKGGPAIADIDNDGQVEIIAINDDKYAEAVDGATGQTEWISNAYLVNTYPHVTVADLDNNGFPEVIADNAILNGRTGDALHQFSISNIFIGRMPAIGDLDLDGQQEVIIANQCRRSDGTLAWESPIIGDYGHWSAILDADGDPQGEVAMVGAGQLAIYNHDGSLISQTSAGTGQPGPPCVADFDGDGEAEIAWASSSLFNMFELDGTVLWNRSVTDASGLAACSGYDIDGDGAYEVLFADEHSLYVFDGSTGTVRFSQTGHASGTIFEFPVVADVDNDGSAEILISSNNFRQGGSGWAGVTIFGHLGSGWAKSGPTWNVHDFAVTNINQDGSVPTPPEPPWQMYNVYRARPTEDAMAVDLFADITDICFAACEPESIVRIAAQPFNQGETSVQAGVPLSLFRKDGASLSFIAQQLTLDRIDAGRGGPGVEFQVLYQDIEGADALVVRADDWGSGFGAIEECDEWNNGIEMTDLLCAP
ncbi:MAG: FG-GAP repeat domain-containing protein [Myxococcota bacterium]